VGAGFIDCSFAFSNYIKNLFAAKMIKIIMKRFAVESSVLSSVGYNEKDKVLEVEFRDTKAVWQYLKLDKRKYDEFRNAESLGNYFSTKIKGKHAERRVG
jgi:hypothetical protein